MPNNLFQFVQSVASILSSVVAIIAGVRGAIRYLRLRKLKQAGQLAMAPAGRIAAASPYMPPMPRPGLPNAFGAPPRPNAPPQWASPSGMAPAAGGTPVHNTLPHIASWRRVISASAAIVCGFLVVGIAIAIPAFLLIPDVRTNPYAFEAAGMTAFVPAALLAGAWGGWVARERNSAMTALLLELVLFVALSLLSSKSGNSANFPTLTATTRRLNLMLVQGIMLAGAYWGVALRARRARAKQWRS